MCSNHMSAVVQCLPSAALEENKSLGAAMRALSSSVIPAPSVLRARDASVMTRGLKLSFKSHLQAMHQGPCSLPLPVQYKSPSICNSKLIHHQQADLSWALHSTQMQKDLQGPLQRKSFSATVWQSWGAVLSRDWGAAAVHGRWVPASPSVASACQHSLCYRLRGNKALLLQHKQLGSCQGVARAHLEWEQSGRGLPSRESCSRGI